MDAGDDRSVEEIVAAALLRDAEAHEAGRFDEIGESWDDVYVRGQERRLVDGQLLPLTEDPTSTVNLAFEFWSCWADDRNHDWLIYNDWIAREDWPVAAREIAAALQAGVAVTDPMLVQHFGPRPPRRSLRRWLVDLVRRPAAQR